MGHKIRVLGVSFSRGIWTHRHRRRRCRFRSLWARNCAGQACLADCPSGVAISAWFRCRSSSRARFWACRWFLAAVARRIRVWVGDSTTVPLSRQALSRQLTQCPRRAAGIPSAPEYGTHCPSTSCPCARPSGSVSRAVMRSRIVQPAAKKSLAKNLRCLSESLLRAGIRRAHSRPARILSSLLLGVR